MSTISQTELLEMWEKDNEVQDPEKCPSSEEKEAAYGVLLQKKRLLFVKFIPMPFDFRGYFSKPGFCAILGQVEERHINDQGKNFPLSEKEGIPILANNTDIPLKDTKHFMACSFENEEVFLFLQKMFNSSELSGLIKYYS